MKQSWVSRIAAAAVLAAIFIAPVGARRKPKAEVLGCSSPICVTEIRCGNGAIGGTLENRSGGVVTFVTIGFAITDRSRTKLLGTAGPDILATTALAPGQSWMFSATIPEINYVAANVNYIFASSMEIGYVLNGQARQQTEAFQKFDPRWYRGPLRVP